MPKRMKTLRHLTAERYPKDIPDSDLPKSVFELDNTTVLYAEFLPPGHHFFYFVRETGTMFLSAKYEIVRFKSTIIFLNRVRVTKCLEQIETVFQAKDGDEDEAVFMKDRSVFRDYREDTIQYLMKCFDEDL